MEKLNNEVLEKIVSSAKNTASDKARVITNSFYERLIYQPSNQYTLLELLEKANVAMTIGNTKFESHRAINQLFFEMFNDRLAQSFVDELIEVRLKELEDQVAIDQRTAILDEKERDLIDRANAFKLEMKLNVNKPVVYDSAKGTFSKDKVPKLYSTQLYYVSRNRILRLYPYIDDVKNPIDEHENKDWQTLVDGFYFRSKFIVAPI